MKKLFGIGALMMTMMFGSAVFAGELLLADKGEARCVIVVTPGKMSWQGDNRVIDKWGRIAGCTALEVEAEMRRRLQRDSVADLALYLGKMSGAKIEVVEGLPAGEKRTPIYIGSEGQKVFGPVGISKAGKFGFRVVADAQKGIGLYGESEYGTSYAIYELLHRLGCRWYMPSEMGEILPREKMLEAPVMDEKRAPTTEYRGMWSRNADADFLRRNRMNGTYIYAQHALEGYIAADLLKANPEWRLCNADGTPIPGHLFRWTREDVAEAVAETIVKGLDENKALSISLSPGDYVRPTEDPEERRHDPEPRVWEPAAGRWSVSDRLWMLANRVAERVGKKHPDVLFGLLAYVNYNLPPAREPVHPNVIPQIAPIDFNRHHPMTWPDHPNGTALHDLVQGWGRKADRVAYYAYGMNLAELSAPCPFITKWSADIPIILKNHCAFWTPETMNGWDSMMPGYYLAIRMTFHPDEKPEALLGELWERFYGTAAKPMARYWNRMDRAWIDANEYSGCLFGYLRLFTPAVMTGARADIDEALALCGTPLEYRRVALIDESLRQFELFMKMREDFAAARLRDLNADFERWCGAQQFLLERYRPQYAFSFPVYGGRSQAEAYMRLFVGAAYEDASRMERDYARHGAAILEWKWKHNPGPEEEALPWTAPGYDDNDWPTTHVVRDTWSRLGHHSTLTDAASGRSGRMAYRATQKLAALPAGKKAFLWIGSTDGSAKVFVNGAPISYIVPADTRRHKAGDVLDRFSGYCQPARFDITDALKTGDNQFTILCERTYLNELGTGGLMGPVVIFREK